jgi:hypothetical protein
MTRINNPEVCVCCSRRADGLAVGRPQRLAWYCNECGPDLARIALQMAQRNMDTLEQRVCIKVAEECGEEPLTIPPNELPAFIAFVVKSFADSMRKELESGGAPF